MEDDGEDEENNNNKEVDDDTNDASATCLQFIANGFNHKNKYNLHFDLGEKRNEEILNNKNEYEKFKENLKLKLSKDYNISKDKIVIAFPERGSVKVQVIFQSDEFNNLDLNEFKLKFEKDDEFEELKNLKEIHKDIIMGACKLSTNMLDPRGNRTEGWGIGERRGNKPYDPPIGWIGIGLKVIDKYEDNTWIGMDNSKGEWCVAYHGVGRGNDSDEVKKITGLIYKGAFKQGRNQVHSECYDQYHPGKKVGEGVYCTPTIKTAQEYNGISTINGKDYETVLMVRVKPEAIRGCKDSEDYWVVNGTTDEIRPYRILYKKLNEEEDQNEIVINYNPITKHSSHQSKNFQKGVILHYNKKRSYIKIISDDFKERSKIELYSLQSNILIEDNEYNFYKEKGEYAINMIIKEEIKDFECMFSGCENLERIDGIMNCSNATNFTSMFESCSSLQNVDGLKDWNVSNGKDFKYKFSDCTSLKSVDGLKNWNVSNGKDFRGMFGNCSSLQNIDDLKNWNVSNGIDFKYLFCTCSSFQNVDRLINWNVSNGINFYGMFEKCSFLKNVNGLKNWNVSKGTNFGAMFYGCSSLQNLDGLIDWNVSNGKYFGNHESIIIGNNESIIGGGIFAECSSLINLDGLQNWNVSNGIHFNDFFASCSSLQNVDGLKKWNVSKGIYFQDMFFECSSLKNIDGLINWNVYNAKLFSDMFCRCSSLKNVDGLRNWNVSNGTDFDTLFQECSSLQNVDGLKNWNVSNGEHFSCMF